MHHELTRRTLLGTAGAALGSLLLPVPAAPRQARPTAGSPLILTSEPWADLMELGDRTWVVVSKPLGGAFDTLCNGGVVAGKERAIAFDGYAQNRGAAWVAEQCEKLGGLWPTDIVLSHHHGDHANGIAGFARGTERPTVWATEETRATALESRADPVRKEMLETARSLSTDAPTEVDLGGRSVTLVPYAGHTVSDVALVADDAGTVFCGDLLWNGLFPNYVDAIPAELGKSVGKLLADSRRSTVPGHGPLPDAGALDRYVSLLGEVEQAARKAHQAGQSAEEAAASFQLPEALGSWTLFSPKYFEVAFGAWHRELEG